MPLTKPYVICLTCTIADSFVAAQRGQPPVVDAYTNMEAAAQHAKSNQTHVMVAGEDYQKMVGGS